MFRNVFSAFILLTSIIQYFFVENSDLFAFDQKKNTVQHTEPPFILVHYMPWFQAKPIRDDWGWHWTMDHYNPEKIDSTGRREIASHFYPLTGPYDSKDQNILEYQVLLMKLSGIDGVIVDWYGIEDFYDYALINESTNFLFEYIKKAKLLFCICYEDQTIKHMVDNNHFTKAEAIRHGQAVMCYMEQQWFCEESYVKLDNRPVLLTFGPQYFFNSSDWDMLFSVLNTPPHFFTLNNKLNPVATGAYPWPPMWKSVNGILTQDALHEFLDSFYLESTDWEFVVGGAFSGFHDIYSQAGLGFTYGFLDSDSGRTLNETLQKSSDNKSDIIQIITWNDYGEGTNIEPTIEYGYQYLETIQRIKKTFIDSSHSYTSQNLLLPFRIYELRKKFQDNLTINTQLDEVFNCIIDDKLNSAMTILDDIDSATSVKIHSNKPDRYSLKQNYPNPFNSQTIITYTLDEPEQVILSLYNASGQQVKRLVNKYQFAGTYSVICAGEGLVSGVYFYEMNVGKMSTLKKCIVLK